MRTNISLTLCLAGALVAQFPGPAVIPALAQQPPDEAWRLVVGVRSTHSSDLPEQGAGVIIGRTGDHLVVATAWHVLVDAVDLPAARVEVQFRDAPGRTVRTGDRFRLGERDLALLFVPMASADSAGWEEPDWSRRARRGSLRRDDAVYAVGCPSTRGESSCFSALPSRDRVSIPDARDEITFLSETVVVGNSGGALFNQWWEVVGLVYEAESSSRAQAYTIGFVLDEAARFLRQEMPGAGGSIALETPATPRGGYNTSVGISWLGEIGADDVLSAGGEDLTPTLERRFPSGRITYRARRSGSRLTWHVGLMRLAPPNLALTSAVLGAGWSLQLGRLSIRPFAELGASRIEARFLASEFQVDTGSGVQTVPIWEKEVQTGLGVGGGLSVGFILGSGIILETSVATWRFETPDQAPGLPALSVGAGLRWGR